MLDEKQNLEPAKLSTAPATLTENGHPENQDYMFFNVMPQVKNQGEVVQPTIVAPVVENVNTNSLSLFKKYKIYILSGLGLLIAGPAIYFLAGKMVSQPDINSNLLVPNTQAPKPKPAPLATTTPEVASTTMFTTSAAWRDKYFSNCKDDKICGDAADPDSDGLTNLEENKQTTDPNNSDSDQDGLADGDELHVFGSNPLNGHTSGNAKYSDSDNIKGGYYPLTNKKMTQQQLNVISGKMQTFGLHQPSLKVLGSILYSTYNFGSASQNNASSTSGSMSSTTLISGIDQSLAAKQDRDAQRSDTIKNIENALVQYHTANNAYPQVQDFSSMATLVKPYLKIATNPLDPINQSPYIYSYTPNASGTDFALSFYSEIAGQLITKNAAMAQKDAATQQAGIYDNQRETDLESLRTALLLYSNANVAGNQSFVFPSKDKYKSVLVSQQYIDTIPKDPKSGNDYDYQVSSTFNTFTLKTVLDNPPTGTTGYMCNQEECSNY